MKAVVLDQPGQFRVIDAEAPAAPGPGQVRVRVQRVGICGTDLHAFRGRQPFFSYPRILGHELGVTVEATGEGVSGLNVGERCAVEPYFECGRCVACRQGKTNCCTTLKVLGVHIDGGMCEHLLVPAAKLHKSTHLTLDQLALVEMLSIGAHAIRRADVHAGEWALVVGAGPIGLSVIQFALLAGAKVIAIDVSAARLDSARRRLGVEHVIDANADRLSALASITAGDLPTVVFDATGNAQSMAAAFRFVAHGGRLVFVGLFQGDVTFHDPEFHRRETTLLASRNATADDFRRVIAAVEHGRIDPGRWITNRSPFDQVPQVFEGWLDPQAGVLKAIVEFGP